MSRCENLSAEMMIMMHTNVVTLKTNKQSQHLRLIDSNKNIYIIIWMKENGKISTTYDRN